MSYQPSDLQENACMFCRPQCDDDCLDCPDNPATATEKRRYSMRQVDNLVGRIITTMEATRMDGESMLSRFDMVELKDVVAEYNSLKQHIGKVLQPEEKAKLIVTAAAWHWLRRDNLIDHVCRPLQHYPELSVDPLGIGKPRQLPTVKVKVREPKPGREPQERLTDATVVLKARNVKDKMPHLTVEVVGSWIWIGDTTYADAKPLKAIGAAWSKHSGKWFIKGKAGVNGKGRYGYCHAANKYGREEIV